MAPTSRKPELSRLNVLFCLLVVYIHVAAHPVSTLDRSGLIYGVILVSQRLSFVSVPGFFLLSGLKFTLPRTTPVPLGRYYLGRAKALLLPYLFVSLAYYLVFVFGLGWFPFSWKDLGGYLVRGDLSAQFYFLIALFQFTALAPVFRWLSRRWSPLLLIPFSLGIMWLSSIYFNDALRIFLPGAEFPYSGRFFTSCLAYYLAGCCIGHNYSRFKALLRENRGLIRALFGLFALADGWLSVLAFSGRRYVPFLEYVHTLYIFSAILFLFDLCAHRTAPVSRLCASIDRVSFDIYLWHCLVITLFNSFAPRLGLDRVGEQFFGRFLITYGVTIGGCLLWHKLLNGIKKENRR